MAWEDALDHALTDTRPARPRSWGDWLGQSLETLSSLDPRYAERQRRMRLMPLEEEALRLRVQQGRSALDDLTRERAERAKAPGSIKAIYDAATPREAVVEWGEEEGAGVTRAESGRKPARTTFDLLERGVSAEDIERGATHLPKAYGALGLQTPEALEKAENETVVIPEIGLVRKKDGTVVVSGVPKNKYDIKETEDGFVVIGVDREGNVTQTPISGVKPRPKEGQPSIDKEIIAESKRLHPNDPAKQVEYQVRRKAEASGAVKREDAPKELLSPDDAAKLRVPYGTPREGAFGSVPKTASEESVEQSFKATDAILGRMETLLGGIKLPTTPAGRASEAPRLYTEMLTQSNPSIALYEAAKEGLLSNVSRTFGERGVLTDQDIKRIRSLFPVIVPGLGQLPDTQEVAQKKMAQIRSILAEIAKRPTPGAAPPAKPAAGTKGGDKGAPAGGETLSRKDALYQKARAKGLSDQQIESQYGIRLTD